MKLFKRYFWVILSALMVAADQLTKWLVMQKIPLNDSVQVITGFFALSHVRNPGAAFGILSGRRWVFMLFTVAVLSAAAAFLLRGKVHNRWGIVSLSMIIGGGVGNMIDRLFRGEVVDFFAFNFWGYEFAVFNVADIFVCCGTVILAFYIFLSKDFKERKVDETD